MGGVTCSFLYLLMASISRLRGPKALDRGRGWLRGAGHTACNGQGHLHNPNLLEHVLGAGEESVKVDLFSCKETQVFVHVERLQELLQLRTHLLAFGGLHVHHTHTGGSVSISSHTQCTHWPPTSVDPLDVCGLAVLWTDERRRASTSVEGCVGS